MQNKETRRIKGNNLVKNKRKRRKREEKEKEKEKRRLYYGC